MFLKIKIQFYGKKKHSILKVLIKYKYSDLANKQVGAITTEDFIKYYASLSEHYSRSTIIKNYAILSQCIAYGNKKQHFSTTINLDEIKIPHEDTVKKKKREIHFLSQDDMKKLLKKQKKQVLLVKL